MAMSKLPILRPVSTGYRDAWKSMRMMPGMAGYALLIMLAINLVEYVVPVSVTSDVIGGNLLSVAVSAAQNFFLTPIMIAVHRFVILDEVTPRYVIEPGQRAFRAFFAWLLTLSIVGLLAFTFFAPKDESSMASLSIVLIVMVVIIVVTTRLSILFPAIAVDAPGASAANAWADSKQHTFSIFLIFLLSALPIMIGAIILIVPFAANDSSQGTALGLPAMIVTSVVQMFFLIMCVAIASKLYQALADRLLRSA
jgi:hypothetical protein